MKTTSTSSPTVSPIGISIRNLSISSSSSSLLASLPVEILAHVFSYFFIEEKVHLSRINRAFRSIYESDLGWTIVENDCSRIYHSRFLSTQQSLDHLMHRVLQHKNAVQTLHLYCYPRRSWVPIIIIPSPFHTSKQLDFQINTTILSQLTNLRRFKFFVASSAGNYRIFDLNALVPLRDTLEEIEIFGTGTVDLTPLQHLHRLTSLGIFHFSHFKTELPPPPPSDDHDEEDNTMIIITPTHRSSSSSSRTTSRTTTTTSTKTDLSSILPRSLRTLTMSRIKGQQYERAVRELVQSRPELEFIEY